MRQLCIMSTAGTPCFVPIITYPDQVEPRLLPMRRVDTIGPHDITKATGSLIMVRRRVMRLAKKSDFSKVCSALIN